MAMLGRVFSSMRAEIRGSAHIESNSSSLLVIFFCSCFFPLSIYPSMHLCILQLPFHRLPPHHPHLLAKSPQSPSPHGLRIDILILKRRRTTKQKINGEMETVDSLLGEEMGGSAATHPTHTSAHKEPAVPVSPWTRRPPLSSRRKERRRRRISGDAEIADPLLVGAVHPSPPTVHHQNFEIPVQ